MAPGRHAGRDSGLRQRRRHGGEADGARRASRSSAIIEYDGAVYNPNGLDIAALHGASQGDRLHHRTSRAARTWIKHEAMFLRCDVLLPAAKENVITSQNADRLRCKILCEGANGPTTAAGRRDSGRQERLRDSGYSGQRRRRHRLVLRMGAGPPGLLLERSNWSTSG